MNASAAIIAIGTEVSSGEIINSNASWLAGKLDAAGISVALHLAVPDEESPIQDALGFAAARASHILTIGGLGPTTDDFTRDVIARWSGGLEMDFDPPSWERIAERFQRLGRSAPESNKQQCYFPRGSKILFNSEGSANAFSLSARGVELTALPGPPREMQAIWNDHLAARFSSVGEQSGKPKLHTWACLGVPESTLAEQVEALMKGSGLQLGYRASAPVVHVKVWVPLDCAAQARPFLEKLDQALDAVCIARNGQDPLTNMKEALIRRRTELKLKLFDEVTAGIFAGRLADLLRPQGIPFVMNTFHAVQPRHDQPSEADWLEVALTATTEGTRLTVRNKGRISSSNLPGSVMPAASDALQINRTRLLTTEHALYALGKALSGLP
ncbi:MAG: hypothetical protein RIQ81_144 [Pseudomonadota bacterium]